MFEPVDRVEHVTLADYKARKFGDLYDKRWANWDARKRITSIPIYLTCASALLCRGHCSRLPQLNILPYL